MRVTLWPKKEGVVDILLKTPGLETWDHVAGLAAPVYLKKAVDALGGAVISRTALNACVAALLLSGACRIFNGITKELQGPVFTPVAQVCISEQGFESIQVSFMSRLSRVRI
jgi:hypothetical protein